MSTKEHDFVERVLTVEDQRQLSDEWYGDPHFTEDMIEDQVKKTESLSDQEEGKVELKSAPSYFLYFTQADCPFFDRVWNEKLSVLQKDMSWVDELQAEEDKFHAEGDWHGPADKFSKVYGHDDFPTFYNWPLSWRNEYEKAKKESAKVKSEHLAGAEIYEIEDCTLYILEEGDVEEVWFSTPHHDHGTVYPMMLSLRDKYDFDSVLTAAYAYKNDYLDWKEQHGANWETTNLLSKREVPYSPSPVGTSHECDGCGARAMIKIEYKDNLLCEICAQNVRG